MNTIGIIICYFGEWPPWLSFFLKSCSMNSTIDWLIFSDHNLLLHSKNIKFYPLSIEKFNNLATEKLEFDIKITNPYKLCDFKPTYGKIFEDYLRKYDFWGYSDIDLVFGQIRNYLSEYILKRYDVLSSHQGFLSGPFCLYKNIPKVNSLFFKAPKHKIILQNYRHIGFDENIARANIIGISIIKIIWYVKYIFLNFKNFLLFITKPKEFRFQYQWFVKKETLNREQLSDMTEVVFFASRNNQLQTLFSNLMITDLYYERINKESWHIRWDQGSLYDIKENKEIFAFHFLNSKNKSNFRTEIFKDKIHSFDITPKGIFHNVQK